jgi:hypothetical protein
MGCIASRQTLAHGVIAVTADSPRCKLTDISPRPPVMWQSYQRSRVAPLSFLASSYGRHALPSILSLFCVPVFVIIEPCDFSVLPSGLAVAHTTLATGSPHILILTKSRSTSTGVRLQITGALTNASSRLRDDPNLIRA